MTRVFSSIAEVVVLVRPGCHLCADASATVRAVCDSAGVSWALVDVDSDASLREQYSDHVPVTFVSGRLLGRWFCDSSQLRAALGLSD